MNENEIRKKSNEIIKRDKMLNTLLKIFFLVLFVVMCFHFVSLTGNYYTVGIIYFVFAVMVLITVTIIRIKIKRDYFIQILKNNFKDFKVKKMYGTKIVNKVKGREGSLRNKYNYKVMIPSNNIEIINYSVQRLHREAYINPNIDSNHDPMYSWTYKTIDGVIISDFIFENVDLKKYEIDFKRRFPDLSIEGNKISVKQYYQNYLEEMLAINNVNTMYQIMNNEINR